MAEFLPAFLHILFRGAIMKSCELVTTISALACCIAQNKSAEELELIAAILTQLADTLATISAAEELCSGEED